VVSQTVEHASVRAQRYASNTTDVHRQSLRHTWVRRTIRRSASLWDVGIDQVRAPEQLSTCDYFPGCE